MVTGAQPEQVRGHASAGDEIQKQRDATAFAGTGSDRIGPRDRVRPLRGVDLKGNELPRDEGDSGRRNQLELDFAHIRGEICDGTDDRFE